MTDKHKFAMSIIDSFGRFHSVYVQSESKDVVIKEYGSNKFINIGVCTEINQVQEKALQYLG